MAIFGLFGGSKDEAARNDQLDHWLEDTHKRELEVDELLRDEDDDIPVRWGSAIVYVRVRYCQDLWMWLFQATSVSVDSPALAGVMSVGRSSSLPL